MINKGVNRIRLIAVAGLVTAALVSTPASAHEGHNYVAPLVAFIALNSLFHRDYYRRDHGHRHHGHHYRHHRKHSHSHGGYQAPRHKRNRHW